MEANSTLRPLLVFESDTRRDWHRRTAVKRPSGIVSILTLGTVAKALYRRLVFPRRLEDLNLSPRDNPRSVDIAGCTTPTITKDSTTFPCTATRYAFRWPTFTTTPS
jgi:hypothetical protein